jgi:hypothetical protein
MTTSASAPPSTLRQARPSWLIRSFNGIARGAARVGLQQRPLDAERILAEARRRTKLVDLGAGDVEEKLRILVRSLAREAGLHPFGRASARDLLVRVLSNRLRIVDLLRRQPEIGRVPIERPIFIIGFPRTGTSVLYNLLAQDPAARPLLFWESLTTVPPSRTRTGGEDPRIRRARLQAWVTRRLAPGFDAVHHTRAEEPEECMSLQLRTLVSWYYLLWGDLEEYWAWLLSREKATFVEAYGFYRQQLQLLQWQRPAGNWVLKSPAHLLAMDALVEVFPDACIVQTHRDPHRALPSACSLTAILRGVMSERVEPRELGDNALQRAGEIFERVLAARKQIAPERVIDVLYRDVVEDPIGVARRIYEHFGRSLSDEAAARMTRWLAEHPRHRHGVHRYTLEEFGLERGQVERACADYVERFGVPKET